MTRRLTAIVAGLILAVLLTAAGCNGPEGTRCGEDGAKLYSSKYGNFTCTDGVWR